MRAGGVPVGSSCSHSPLLSGSRLRSPPRLTLLTLLAAASHSRTRAAPFLSLQTLTRACLPAVSPSSAVVFAATAPLPVALAPPSPPPHPLDSAARGARARARGRCCARGGAADALSTLAAVVPGGRRVGRHPVQHARGLHGGFKEVAYGVRRPDKGKGADLPPPAPNRRCGHQIFTSSGGQHTGQRRWREKAG